MSEDVGSTGTPNESKPKKPIYKRWWFWTIAVVVLFGIGGAIGGVDSSSGNNANETSTTTTASSSSTTNTPTTAAPNTSTTAASGPVTSFGKGTHLVGTANGDITPGTYRTAGSSGCYWARLSGLGGSIDDIIANNNASGPAIVTIEATDKAFESTRCGEWSPAPTSGPQATSFGDGTWAVGIDIAPGTYKAPGGSACYWERLSAFGAGSVDGIIANANPTGPVVVQIAPTDKGFQTRGCGEWMKTG